MHTPIRWLITLALLTQLNTQAQQPTIKANATAVNIQLNDDYYAKGSWILEPAKNPDTFFIPSKWPQASRQLIFHTDIDSLVLATQAGQQYSFVVMLKDSIPCNIVVMVARDPIFFNRNILISLMIGFPLFGLLLLLFRRKLKNRLLLLSGYVACVLFWSMTLISGNLHGNYHHLKNVVSELGTVNTQPELFTSCCLVLLTLLSILFSIGLYRASQQYKISVLPAICSFAMPFSMLWAGVFPLGNQLHGAIGPLPLLTLLGCLLSFILWKRNPSFTKARQISLLAFCIMLLLLTRFITPFGVEYEGLTQRFFYLGWTVWTGGLTYRFLKDERQ